MFFFVLRPGTDFYLDPKKSKTSIKKPETSETNPKKTKKSYVNLDIDICKEFLQYNVDFSILYY